MRKSLITKILLTIILLLHPAWAAADAGRGKALPSETPKPISGLDERWQRENQELIALIQGNKLAEARQAAQNTLGYLGSRKLLQGQEAATTHNNLGMVLLRLGRFDEAEGNLLKALEIRRRIYGDAGAEVGLIWENLAELLKTQAQGIRERRIAEEIKKTQARLAAMKEGEKQGIEAAAAYQLLGSLQIAVNQLEPARVNLLASLKIYRTRLGEDSAEAANILFQLADIYRLQAQIVIKR